MATKTKTTGTARYGEAEWQTRVDLAAAYRLADHFGFSQVIYNHITARVPGANEHFLINRFGWHYGEITASSLVKIDLEGNVIDGPDEINQPGYVIHSAVHSARRDVHCVMHTHTPGGLAVSALETGFIPMTQDAFEFYDRVAYHEFEGLALDTGERERLVADLGDLNVLILRNHGLLTVGPTIDRAFMRMYNLEKACVTQVQAMATGHELHMPPAEVCERTAQQLNGRKNNQNEWPALLRLLDAKDPSYTS